MKLKVAIPIFDRRGEVVGVRLAVVMRPRFVPQFEDEAILIHRAGKLYWRERGRRVVANLPPAEWRRS